MGKYILSGLSLLIAGTALFMSFYSKEKLVYVDTGKLFSEFKLAKELDQQSERVLKQKRTILDSLYESVRSLSIEVKATGSKDVEKVRLLSLMQEELMYKKQLFEEENQKMSADFMSKIWTQLNQYISDFGKKNKYTYMLGATGQGNLLYADEAKNVTDDLIEYVNNRYEGKKDE